MPPRQASVSLALFLSVAMLALTIGLSWWQLPSLLQDFVLHNNVEPAQSARLVGGSCKSKLILYMCSTEIEYRADGHIRNVSEGFSFVGFHFGAFEVQVLQHRGDPRLVTTSLALDNIWNRILTTLPLILFFGFTAIVLLKNLPATARLARRFKGWGCVRLTPLAVDVYGYRDKNNDRVWYYGGPSATEEKPHEIISSRTRPPFFLNGDGSKALAVAGGHDRQPLLLDQALSYLKISDKERAELIAWHLSLMDKQHRPAAA